MTVFARNKSGPHARRCFSTCVAGLLAFALAWFAIAPALRAAVFQDYFTNREILTASSGQIEGNNTNATVEVGEPKHGGKTGGHSLWISWIAPTNGVAKFETGGSTFDTLLSIYRFASTNDTTFDKLIPVGTADDSEGFEHESELEFGVQTGQRYEIAVDGYFGATGPLELNWDFKTTAVAPPVLISTPPDRAVRPGDPVTLTVVLSNVVSAQYKWYFNGNEIDVTSTNLIISSFQVTNVGRYKMRIEVSGESYFVAPTEVQINTDGATNTLAQGKILDAPGSPLLGGDGGSSFAPRFSTTGGSRGPLTGVVRGYNGSQIFNTTYAVVDTNEPPHCGISNGPSYWLIYQPPTNGTITLDTIGSSYDTVIEAYTYNGALTGYQDLISIACDNNSVGSNGAARVQFPVVKSRQYVVAVEGVNGATGAAWLNYSLNTNQLPAPPTLLSQPTTIVAFPGTNVTLAPSVAGAPPLRFSWKKNTTPMSGVTTPALFFSSVTATDSADYIVTVTNDLGTLNATLPLHVVIPPQCSLKIVSNYLQLTFGTVSGLRYSVEEAVEITGPWQPWPDFYIGDGQPVALNLPGGGTKFYRVLVQ